MQNGGIDRDAGGRGDRSGTVGGRFPAVLLLGFT